MNGLWLYVHFPALQLDTLFSQQAPEHAVIVFDQARNQVVQCNHLAIQAGIRTGMGLGSASALVSDLCVIPYRTEQEQATLQGLAEQLYTLTSDICLYPPNGLLLRIHNMLDLYGGLAPYWQAIKLCLLQHSVQFDYATGVSPLCARILARTSWNTITANEAAMRQQLSCCKLTDTELPGKTIRSLTRVGVHTLAELMRIPLKDLAKRFDNELVTYLGKLTGELQHQVTFFMPPEHFQRYMELLYDIDNTDKLLKPIVHMLNAMAQFLKQRDLLTEHIQLTLHLRDTESMSLSVASAQGEYRVDVWSRLIALKLENIQLHAPVYGITLYAAKAYLRQPEASDLFAGKRGTLSAMQLVAMLQAKLGEQAVSGLHLRDDHRPEHASYYAPPLRAPLTEPPSKGHIHNQRPIFMYTPPMPLQQRVSIVFGPERIYSGWWDGDNVLRDYYIARNDNGQWLWVFRTPDQKWFTQGMFS